MTTMDYTISEVVKNSPEAAYTAITSGIADWWTREFEGTGNKLGESFTVRFGSLHHSFKVMKVTKLDPANEVIWECTDALINLTNLNNKKEWVGTKIVWAISPAPGGSKITLTHEGLTADLECMDVSNAGWISFIGSLVKYLETGTGTPLSN